MPLPSPFHPRRVLSTLLAASLLGACATAPRAVKDEGTERIENIIGRPDREEPIPEGISFVPDTSPLPEDALAVLDEPATTDEEPPPPRNTVETYLEQPSSPYSTMQLLGLCTPPRHGAFHAPHPPACTLAPGSIRFHIGPRPGGSIPGLLP
ncbi:hypothetical protein [Myxococcus sp. CA039A]|uniref:hypothetical protein n=1 Tax=Myxococcus sp. CA039A TaxID=2741737 RepID=UPI00157B5F32|nr:hypothetical protein [Myxococcus sp. CA039A]NTX56151.1 hypothetical protein [Myxococcus sp. CA039A]